jgi:small subunit ribosomal protein S20
VKSEVRSAVKRFTQAVESKDESAAEQSFRSMVKLLDTAGRKGIFHKNMVARKKSRMQKLLNSISG